MKHEETRIGELVPDGEMRRDAVHVAVAPVEASVNLTPGCRVILLVGSSTKVRVAADYEGADGIADPFLDQEVIEIGQRFWMFLFPGTITGMRHSWRHPAFEAAARERRSTDG
jgi:hypothetical protein